MFKHLYEGKAERYKKEEEPPNKYINRDCFGAMFQWGYTADEVVAICEGLFSMGKEKIEVSDMWGFLPDFLIEEFE